MKKLLVGLTLVAGLATGWFFYQSQLLAPPSRKLAAIPEKGFRWTVLHTNDLHSHLEGSGPDIAVTTRLEPGNSVRGHSAHLLSLIRQFRQDRGDRHEPVLLFDSGDFLAARFFKP